MRSALLFAACLFSLAAAAAPVGPATLDRSTWPEQLSNPTLFDVASRAEILTFARALLASEALDEPALKQRLGLRMINLEAINAVRESLNESFENHSSASLMLKRESSPIDCPAGGFFAFVADDPVIKRTADAVGLSRLPWQSDSAQHSSTSARGLFHSLADLHSTREEDMQLHMRRAAFDGEMKIS